MTPTMTPAYFYPTPLQLAALGVTVASDIVWNAAHDANASAYGYVHDARYSLTDRMGGVERTEFWALFGLLGEFRHVARAALGAAS